MISYFLKYDNNKISINKSVQSYLPFLRGIIWSFSTEILVVDGVIETVLRNVLPWLVCSDSKVLLNLNFQLIYSMISPNALLGVFKNLENT